jgi:type IV pilus assembly protein PilE
VRARQQAFTLIELMIVVVVVGVLARIAYPMYVQQVVKGSRTAAQSQLLELSNLQEKIYLNSNLYTGSVTTAYNGKSDGGLGVTSGTTNDARYTLTLAPTTASSSFTLTATPDLGTSQDADGYLSIDSSGLRNWGSTSVHW